MEKRIIGHLDMDAFFASVEERERPYLKGKPLIVGADPQGGRGRGVVSTASYAARKYGIGSATPITKAWKLCDKAKEEGKSACVFITGGFEKYGKASKEVFAVVKKYVSLVEKVGVDEGYVDFSFCGSFKNAGILAEKIKNEIRRETKLSCSIGIGPNKLIAKIASDFKKPNGLTIVTDRKAEQFLEPLSLGELPGIGPSALKKFSGLEMYTVKDAKALDWSQLEKMFGSWGFGMYEKLRGIDRREVRIKRDGAKSVGKHHTFSVDTNDFDEIFSVLQNQTKVILERMKKNGFAGFRTVVLTVRFDDFSTTTRSSTNKKMLSTKKELETKAMKLALPFFEKKENPHMKLVRLIGLRIEKLEC